MRWIEKQARYYQGYLADERSLIPVTILLANAVAIWLFVYLISSVGNPSQPQTSLSPHPSTSAIFRNPPVGAAGQAGRGFLGEGFLSQRLARAATSALSRSASKALGLKSSPSHSRVSAWRSWPGSSSASSISP
jgi:hypothetical protein